jgi:hypothetical protein
MPNSDEVLAKIDQRLSKLEGGGKDRWDKFQILASLLIPAAVAFAGYYFSNAMADAQRDAENQRAEASQLAAEASTRVSQAELISTFMRSLLSENRAEKELAIRAVILALPEAGPQLVAVIQVSSVDPETKKVARQALVERREKLVEDLHSADEPSRHRATEQLVLGFRQDPELADRIAASAESHPEDREGIASSAQVLNAVSSEQIRTRAEAVRRLEKVAEPHGAKTRELLQQIKLRLNVPPPAPAPAGTPGALRAEPSPP